MLENQVSSILSIFFPFLRYLDNFNFHGSLELKVTTGDIFQPKVYNLAQLTFFGYNLAGKNVSFFDVLRSALIDYKRLQGIPMTDSLLVARVHEHRL